MSNTTTTPVAKPTYLELISQDEKTIKVEALRIEAQRASISVQTTIMELNSNISIGTMELAKVQRQVPYSVQAEFEIEQRLELLRKRLAFAQTIKAERFSDVTI